MTFAYVANHVVHSHVSFEMGSSIFSAKLIFITEKYIIQKVWNTAYQLNDAIKVHHKNE